MQPYPYRMAPPYTLTDLRARRAEIEEIAARHHASNIRVVGSAARGDADQLSDVDLLVDMDREGKLTGFTYFGELDSLERELAELLDCKVDVIDARGIETNAPLLVSGARLQGNLTRDAVAL